MTSQNYFLDIAVKKIKYHRIFAVQRNKFIVILVYKSKQDAQVTEFILSDNCSTCFGRHYHPSSGAQNNKIFNSSTIAVDNITV